MFRRRPIMKRILCSIFGLFEYVIVIFIFIMLIDYVLHGTEHDSNYAKNEPIKISESESERNGIIKSVIVWNTDYSKEIENSVIYNLNLLPDDVLDSWLSKDSSIIICPNVIGYLDVNDTDSITDETHGQDKAYYTNARNSIHTLNNSVIGSDIYILGSTYYVNNSLLHEIGHYVYYEHLGTSADYILPNFKTDSKKFAKNERKGFSYFTISDEYFAEIFAYTIKNGIVAEYNDTYVMEKIIEDLQSSYVKNP